MVIKGQRVKVREVMDLTGLSRATVDRVVNGRGGTHPETERSVLNAIDRLGERRGGVAKGGLPRASDDPVQALFRLDRGLTGQLLAAAREQALPVSVENLDGRDENEILEAVRRACRTDHPLIVTTKAHAPIVEELVRARRRGKRVIAMVSDLVPDARDGYVGIDDRRAGETVAYLIGSQVKGRPAKVAVVLGDYAFRCHEDREIGFRSGLRAMFPDIAVVDIAKGDDSSEMTRNAVRDLLGAHPDLDGIYNVAGGNDGLVEAIAEWGLSDRVTVVCHETNDITVPLIRCGALHFLISQNASTLLQTALDLARQESGAQHKLIDFQICTPFNLPLA